MCHVRQMTALPRKPTTGCTVGRRRPFEISSSHITLAGVILKHIKILSGTVPPGLLAPVWRSPWLSGYICLQPYIWKLDTTLGEVTMDPGKLSAGRSEAFSGA